MYDHQFIKNFRKVYGVNLKDAAKDLGVSYMTVTRWMKKGTAPLSVKRLVDITARGFLPDTGGWAECYIDKENYLVTPWCKISAGEVAFYRQKKWAAEHYASEFRKLKNSIPDDQMLLDDVQDKLLDIVHMLSVKTGT